MKIKSQINHCNASGVAGALCLESGLARVRHYILNDENLNRGKMIIWFNYGVARLRSG